MGEKREGDPPYLVSEISKAKKILNWQPSRDINKILNSAIQWELKKL